MEAPVNAEQTVDQAFAAIMKANFDYMLTWEKVAYNKESIRGVHQTRVSFRRMRSALSVFRKAIPREAVEAVGAEMKWFASELGSARDTDVFIDEALGDKNIKGKIGPKEGEDKMLVLAEKKNEIGYDQVRKAIDDPRFIAFKKDFPQWLKTQAWRDGMSSKGLKKLDKSVIQFANSVLNKRLGKILAAGDDLSVLSEYELHELRIKCKKLRYSMEFFSPLYDQETMTIFSKRFKAVQRQLGIINDVAVMPGLLEAMLEGVDDADTKAFADGVAKQRRSQQAGAIAMLPALWTDLGTVTVPWAAPEAAPAAE